MDENNNVMLEEVSSEPEVAFAAEESGGNSGIGTGVAMLIGSGLTVAAIAAGNKIRSAWKKHKAKKEAQTSDNTVEFKEIASDETANDPE